MDADPSDESRNSVEALDQASILYLRKLMQNKSLGKNQTYMQKIYKFVSDAKENEKRLINKCDTLQAVVIAKEKQNESAMLLSREDQAMVESLKKQLEQSWQTIDESYEKEEKSIATISELKEKLLVKSNLYMQNNECGIQQLVEENEKLAKKLQSYENQLQRKTETEKEWETTKSELMAEVSKRTKLVESVKSKLDMEVKKKNEFEKEIKKLKSSIDVPSTKSKSSDLSCASSQCSSTKLHKQLLNRSKALEKAQTSVEESKMEIEKLQQETETKNNQILDLTDKVKALTADANLTKKQLETTRKELSTLTRKVHDTNLTKDLKELNKKYTSLKAEYEDLKQNNKEKILKAQELAKQKEEGKRANHLLRNQCRDLKDSLDQENSEKEELKERIFILNNEMKNQKILIKQTEKVKESYNNNMLLLEEENQMLIQKIRQLEYNVFLSSKNTTLQSNSSTEIEETLKKDITLLQEELINKEHEIKHLNNELQNREKQIKIDKNSFPKNDTEADHFDDQFMKIGDTPLQNKVTKATKHAILLNSIQEENQQLTDKVEVMQNILYLLNKKLELKDEVLQRGIDQSKQQEEMIYHLEQKICNLEDVIQQDEEHKSISTQGIDNPNNSCETLDSDSCIERGNNITNLMEQLKLMEETLAVKTREVKDKSECIREQFDIIEELRKCLAHSDTEQEMAAFRQQMKKKEDIIKSLRDKANLYEKYIREYQVEVKQLQTKLHGTLRLGASKESNLNTQVSSLLQTKKLEPKSQAKKFRGGGYRIN